MNLFNRRKKFKPSEQDLMEIGQVTQRLEQATAGMPSEIIVEAHKHCAANKIEVQRGKLCGCFYCLEVFSASEINGWIDYGKTALCPRCGIDSVLGDTAGFKLDLEFLQSMHKYWF